MTGFSAEDSRWMAEALRLAECGLNTTRPNPRVGCVLVSGGRQVGAGWHQRAGEAHAEVHALRAAAEAGHSVRGATAYVTLEPCSHFGRTPPCADALIAAGISRVVVAMQDPNPQVSGNGIARLRAAGITVDRGLMEAAARELNIGFVARMTRGTPWLRSKIAASLDGRTALKNGQSQWITGAAARQDVQCWRARSCAVLTGSGTVLADDPQLNLRADELRGVPQPLRVVLDSRLRTPLAAKILRGGGTLIYTASADAARIRELEQAGAQIVSLPDADGQVDLSAMLRDLAQRGIGEVLVEAGATLNGALLRAGLVDEWVLYLAPQLLGDAARGLAALGELTRLEQKVALVWQDVRQLGGDLRIVATVRRE